MFTNHLIFFLGEQVAIQMNCKLGGLPWIIDMPLTGLMTIGYDVCHDPKDKKVIN